MSAAVVVDVSSIEASPAHVATLLGACTGALRAGTCDASPPANPADSPGSLVVELTETDQLEFELHLGAAADHAAVTRRLSFRLVDAVDERWRSVGIAIATLVGEVREAPPEPPPAPIPSAAPAPPLPVTSRVEASEPPRADRWRLAIGSGLGRGAKDSPARLGAFVSTALPLPLPSLFVTAAGRYSLGRLAGTAVHLDWTTLALGVGVGAALGPVALRADACAVLDRFSATVDDAFSGASSASARWLGGALVGVEAAWPANAPVSALVLLDAAQLSGATDVRVDAAVVGQNPAYRWDFLVGLEARP